MPRVSCDGLATFRTLAPPLEAFSGRSRGKDKDMRTQIVLTGVEPGIEGGALAIR